MNRTVSFSLALLLILSGIGGLLFIRSHQKMGNPGVRIVSVPICDVEGVRIANQSIGLPEKVLDFSSVPGGIAPEEFRALHKDTTFGRRIYTNSTGFMFTTSAILMGRDRTSIHKPQFCLTGQGWHIDRSEIVSLRVDRPHPYDLPVMKLTASQQQIDESGRAVSYTALYVYWFVTEDNVTAEHSRRMWSMLRVLLEKGILERWAYISFFTVCTPGEEDAAFQELSRAIRAAVPDFQTTSGPPLTAAARAADELPKN